MTTEIIEINRNDSYRTANRMKANKEGPRPISLVGAGRSGSLIAFAVGQGRENGS